MAYSRLIEKKRSEHLDAKNIFISLLKLYKENSLKSPSPIWKKMFINMDLCDSSLKLLENSNTSLVEVLVKIREKLKNHDEMATLLKEFSNAFPEYSMTALDAKYQITEKTSERTLDPEEMDKIDADAKGYLRKHLLFDAKSLPSDNQFEALTRVMKTRPDDAWKLYLMASLEQKAKQVIDHFLKARTPDASTDENTNVSSFDSFNNIHQFRKLLDDLIRENFFGDEDEVFKIIKNQFVIISSLFDLKTPIADLKVKSQKPKPSIQTETLIEFINQPFETLEAKCELIAKELSAYSLTRKQRAQLIEFIKPYQQKLNGYFSTLVSGFIACPYVFISKDFKIISTIPNLETIQPTVLMGDEADELQDRELIEKAKGSVNGETLSLVGLLTFGKFTVSDLKEICEEANYDIETSLLKANTHKNQKYQLIDVIYKEINSHCKESGPALLGWSIIQDITISLNRNDRYCLLRDKLKNRTQTTNDMKEIDIIYQLDQVNRRERALVEADPEAFRDSVTKIVLGYL